MKLFIVVSLIAVASAGRLENLERSYLPPDQGSNQGRYGSQSGFGSSPSSFGSSSFGSASHGLGGHGGFGSSPSSFGSSSFGSSSHGLGGHGGFGSGSFDSNGIETQSAVARPSANSAFPGATINQYLPPDHGPSASNGGFSGSLQGFGNQRSQYTPQSSFRGSSQYSAPSTQYGIPSSGAQARYQSQQFGSQRQGSSQFSAASRQYLAPQAPSNYPQQPFDEQTGYHY